MGIESALLGGAGLNFLGGLMGADAAKDAASAQAGAANKAAELQYQMFLKQLELQEPFRQGGMTAQNRLMQLLGLQSANPYSQYEGMSRDQLRAALLPQFTAGGTAAANMPGGIIGAAANKLIRPGGQAIGTIDETGLNSEIDKILSGIESYNSMASSPDFGKYGRDFSMSDFEADPGYGFRLSEGLKALDQQAAARGGLISGAALKASQRYGQDMASQEYTNAFNRYQVNRANQLNPLQSLMGAGQTAAGTIGNAAQNYGNQAGSAYMDAGNARASGYVGSSNALTGALGSGLNFYQNYQLMKGLGM